MNVSVIESPSLPIIPTKIHKAGNLLPATFLFALIYILCALAVTVPLLHTEEALPGTTWMSEAIITIGSLFHIPSDLHILQDHYGSQKATGFSEFLLVLVITFASYVLYAFYLKRQKEHLLQKYRHIMLSVIVITTVIVTFIYIFTPVTASEDIYLYAAYGRILVFHHANPYFVTPIHFLHDPVLPFVYWKHVLAIYGPIWMLVCAFLTSFSGTVPLEIFIAFRIFACSIHLINIILILSIMRTKNHSIHTVLLIVFLYALNPLILFESSLGGHNDILVAMFLLLGLFAAVHAEKKGKVHSIHYLPALLALTGAALVKCTIIPIIVLFIVMLFFKACSSSKIKALPMSRRVLSALSTVLLANVTCAAVTTLFYGPFWIGHSMQAITTIFSSQPPVTHSLFSLLAIAQFWSYSHPLPITLAPLASVHTWNIITYGGMALVMILGCIRLRHTPTTQNVIFITLGTMAVFLLTTNWFTPWYVLWLLSLTVICLPVINERCQLIIRIQGALIAFAFTLSFSSFMAYNSFVDYEYLLHPPQYNGLIMSFLLIFSLPTLSFLVFLMRKPRVPHIQ